MKVYLLDVNKNMIDAWKNHFGHTHDVWIVNDNFDNFMNHFHDVDCVVSPANSFGLMDGGYDLAITKYFGNQLQERVQQYIIKNYYGEQPVGTSMVVPADGTRLLIHTPTMRYPQLIIDKQVIYHCMRSTMICAMQNHIGHIIIPAFGGGCGRVPFDVIAEMMYKAYMQFKDIPEELDWNYVSRRVI
jgi:O-acetyl-ADP-ribose deacetylase (regulator of RNase III)